MYEEINNRLPITMVGGVVYNAIAPKPLTFLDWQESVKYLSNLFLLFVVFYKFPIHIE